MPVARRRQRNSMAENDNDGGDKAKGTPDKEQLFNFLLKKVRETVVGSYDTTEKLFTICTLLMDTVPYYDWVGFYLVDPPGNKELVLGPFVGEPPEHVRIPFGTGICGQAAERKVTVIAQDVSKEVNYLSCSPKVKAEIIVPIFKNGELVGELDIDSHTRSPFTLEDRIFLENICEIVSALF